MKNVQTLLGVGASIATAITFSAISLEPIVADPTPSMTSLSPKRGPIAGETSTAMNGVNFDVPTVVTFGGIKNMVNTIASNLRQVTALQKTVSPVNVTVNQVVGTPTINNPYYDVSVPKTKTSCDKGGGNGSESCNPGNSPNKGHDDETGKRK